jgi:lactoylglutathione lyase
MFANIAVSCSKSPNMTITKGLNHLGLSVYNLDQTVAFFVDCLGWQESGRDDSYPRSAVSDGTLRLTLWQIDHSLEVNSFQFRKNVGLHHFALEIGTEVELNMLAQNIQDYPGVTIEFMPELLGTGPRKHMMFNEPGGIRIEIIWPGI